MDYLMKLILKFGLCGIFLFTNCLFVTTGTTENKGDDRDLAPNMYLKEKLQSDNNSTDYVVETVTQDEIKAFLKVLSIIFKDLEAENKTSGPEDKPTMKMLKFSNELQQIIFFEPQEPEIKPLSLLYKEPEPWSSCRRSCKTSRIRKCRLPDLCHVDVLVEEAFCYQSDTKCEQIVKKIIDDKDSNSVDEMYDVDTESDFYFAENEPPSYDYAYFIPENDYQSISNDIHNNGWYDDSYNRDYDVNLMDALFNLDLWEPIEDSNVHYDYFQETEPSTTTKKPFYPVDDEKEMKNECGKAAVSIPYKMFKIIGGKEAIKGSWPWQVAILNRFKEVVCGGTIIASRWVITAAHCVRKKLFVRVGSHDINSYAQKNHDDILVLEAIKHPDFDVEAIDNDIALLRLKTGTLKKSKKRYKKSQKACLPYSRSKIPSNQKCIILGWGKERESHIFGSDVLRYAKVPIVNRTTCQDAYWDFKITRNMFCAGYLRGGIDACEGDSGGPLLCQNSKGRWVLHGVTSFGDGCGEKGKLGVYVKVSNYIEWIKQYVSFL